MTSSNVNNAGGYLDVFVDSGSGYVLEASGNFAEGSVVMQKCFKRLEGVQVHGPNNNAWAGTFYLSLAGGRDYTFSYTLKCLDCTGVRSTCFISSCLLYITRSKSHSKISYIGTRNSI